MSWNVEPLPKKIMTISEANWPAIFIDRIEVRNVGDIYRVKFARAPNRREYVVELAISRQMALAAAYKIYRKFKKYEFPIFEQSYYL